MYNSKRFKARQSSFAGRLTRKGQGTKPKQLTNRTSLPASLMTGYKIDSYHVHNVICAKEKASRGSERSV